MKLGKKKKKNLINIFHELGMVLNKLGLILIKKLLITLAISLGLVTPLPFVEKKVVF